MSTDFSSIENPVLSIILEEYKEASGNFRDLVKIRFTTLAAFFVCSGFIFRLGSDIEESTAIYLVGVAICVAFILIDLRTRQLIDATSSRLVEIEDVFARITPTEFLLYYSQLHTHHKNQGFSKNKLMKRNASLYLFGFIRLDFKIEFSYSKSIDFLVCVLLLAFISLFIFAS